VVRFVLFRWRRHAPARSILAAAGVLACGVLASGLVTDRDGYSPTELPNADRIAEYVSQNIRPGDAILAAMITNTPLEYYLNYRGVPFHHIIVDDSWTFNAYSLRKGGMPNPDCWTRLIVIENRGFPEESLDRVLRFMGQIGPVSTETLWEGEQVKVYGVSKLPERIAGMAEGTDWVLNGGFEARDVCWWNRGTAVVQEKIVHSGARSLKIGPRTGGAWQPIALRKSSKYRLTAWGRLSREGDVGWLGVSLTLSNLFDDKKQCEIHNTGWQKCTLTFDTPRDLVQATVWAWKPDGESEFEVDDLDVEAQPK
jgi:hypothetical protein